MKISDEIKAYIFDLDYTLFDEMQFFKAGMRDVGEYVCKKYNIPAKDVYEFCVDSVKKEGRGKTFNHLIERYSLDEDVKKLVEIYRNTRPSLELYDDAKEVLDALKKEGKLIGIITDGNAEVQEAKVRLLGLFDIIDALILPDALVIKGETHFTKPNPVVYEACLEKLGVKPEEAVYIGDNPLKDFVGARSLGMKTVQIERKNGMFENCEVKEGYEADFVTESLIELL
ncbi:MAG: HAD-IA family hydrolase [Lachnospiraceae bacterium]|nr:HAD-IA family hydrolase [Lachnospiraceae bacterium]